MNTPRHLFLSHRRLSVEALLYRSDSRLTRNSIFDSREAEDSLENQGPEIGSLGASDCGSLKESLFCHTEYFLSSPARVQASVVQH